MLNAASFGTNNPDVYTAIANGPYTSILGRAPTAAELTAVVSSLTAGARVDQLAATLMGSYEGRTKDVTHIYNALFNRPPDTPGLNTALAQLGSGTSVEQIALTAFGSAEFKARAAATVMGVALLLLLAINAARTANGNLPPMTTNADLQAMAQEHASFMAKVEILSHDDAGDGTFVQRLEASAYQESCAAEIIATGSSIDDAMSEWMGEQPPDDPHRQAILSACVDAGCASAIAADGTGYYCCDFGVPA